MWETAGRACMCGSCDGCCPVPRAACATSASPEAAGQLSAVLFFLCGLLVVAASPAINGPQVHRLLLVLVGLTAAVSGVVIVALPWHRWPRAATLWLVPMAFGLIALHNWATGGDGIRYNVFFLVVAAWVGLMHPRGTTLACTPAMVGAYLLPGFALGNVAHLAGALTYAVPVFVLVGESASLVAERVRISEAEVRASEQRFRALVQNSADAISVVGADATILWDSPGITSVLGYEPEERVGTAGFDYLHPDDAEEATSILGELLGAPGTHARRLSCESGTATAAGAIARSPDEACSTSPLSEASSSTSPTSPSSTRQRRPSQTARRASGFCSPPTRSRCGCTTQKRFVSSRSMTRRLRTTATRASSSSR